MNDAKTYLDYAATTPVKPEVKAVVGEAMALHGNASSVHGFGRAAREQVEGARSILAARYKVKPAQVVFTSGATEANNTALQAFRNLPQLVSAIEHPSILQTALNVSDNPQLIRVDGSGVINLNHLEELLKAVNQPVLVSIMLVNNETGVIQPVAEAAALAKRYGAIFHCDAVQGAGRIQIDFTALGVDMLSLSAHKLGGPQGVGALLLRDGLSMPSFVHGGTQEMRRRAGTENVAGVAGFGKAVSLIDADLARQNEWAGWRSAFEQRIKAAVPEAIIFGVSSPRVAALSCIAMPNVRNDTQLMAFDLAGLAVSSGSACSSGKVQPSPVLKAMQFDEQTAMSAIRVSFGWASQAGELEKLAEKWIELYQRTAKTRAA